MASFGLQDLGAVAQLARWIYDNAFDQNNDAAQQYRDFGSEIRLLSENLSELEEVASDIERHAAELPSHMRNNGSRRIRVGDLKILLDACGDFEATIEECAKFLRDNAKYGREQALWKTRPWLQRAPAPLSSIIWNQTVKSSVVRLKDRVAVHSSKIQGIVGALQLKLLHDLKISNEDAFKYIIRNQNGQSEMISRRILQRASSNQADDGGEEEDMSFVMFEMNHYVLLKRKLEIGFRNSLPDLRDQDHRNLTLEEGYSGLNYHSEQWMAKNLKSGDVGCKDYLELLKSIHLLEKIRASREYETQVKRLGNWFWAQTFCEIEEKIAGQAKRFSPRHARASRLKAPAAIDFDELYADDFLLKFDSGDESDSDAVPAIALETADEMLRLPLIGAGRFDVQELRLLRQPDMKLVLKLHTSYSNRAGTDVNAMTIDLQKISIRSLWATTSSMLSWHARFHAGPGHEREETFRFLKAQDQYAFQHAMLDYKVGFNGEAKDIGVKTWDDSLRDKESKFLAKFEIWYDSQFAPPNLSQDFTPTSPTCLSPSLSRPATSRTSLFQNEAAQSGSADRRASVTSLPSSVSSGRTSASVSSLRSTYSSPISSTDGNVTSYVFYQTTEPMLVFFIREQLVKEGKRPLRQLLAVKFGRAILKFGCNLNECRKGNQCPHATISLNKGPLDVMRVNFRNGDWNVAALGKHQQNGNHVERPPKIYRVHLRFDTIEDRGAFAQRFRKVQEIWIGKNRLAYKEMSYMRNQNVIAEDDDDWD